MPSPRPSESSSSVPSVPSGSAPASSKSQVTVWTTQTTAICDSTSSVPTVPVQTPSSSGGGSTPSQTVPVPVQTPSGGSSPSQSTPSVSPSQSTPGGGSVPSGTSSAPGGGSMPSGTSSAPQPSGSSSGGGNGGSGNSCPTNLNGQYTTPHLIIPVDSSSPDTAPGTSYNGTISSSKTTLYNFDIPQSYESKTCSLVFLFPKQEDLETSAFTFSGDGKIDFAKLKSPAQQSTSYNNIPAVEQDYGVTTVSPGNSYTISTFSCPAGQSVGYEMKNAGSTYLDFFEDYNPSPLGLYITTC